MNKAGFFLVETIIYVALFSLIIALLMPAVLHDISILTARRQSLQRTVQVHAALQRFVRDVQKAPHEKKQWLVFEEDKLVWKYNDESVGWLIEKGNFMRRQGIYKREKNIWKKKTQSLAAHSIKSVTFEVEQQEEYIKAITIRLVAESNTHYSQYITLRNRIV